MKILCQVTDYGLVPMYDSDLEERKKLKRGTIVTCEIKKPRNYLFHKKFFALLRLTYENLPYYLHEIYNIHSEEDLRLNLMIDLGISSIVNIGGRNVYKKGSISFASMDEAEFQGFYTRCINMILNKYLKGTRRQDLIEEVEHFL